jgi:long-chain acyl-CoA synthetase
MLRETAARHGERTAIADGTIALTYSHLEQTIAALAADLRNKGVHQGDRVALLFPNQLEFVTSFFSILSLGAIAVPLNSHYQQNDICDALRGCDTSYLVTSPQLSALWEQSPALRQAAPSIFIVEPQPANPPLRVNPCELDNAIDPDTPAICQFSSGSTGNPKRIARTHRQLLGELESLVQALKVTAEDRFLGVMPFAHVNGLVRSMMLSLRAGATLFPLAKFERHTVARTIERSRITMWISVPFMFGTIAQTSFRPEPDFSSLRFCISASAPLPHKVCEQFYQRFGIHLRQLYGCTETGSISVNLSSNIESSLESVGTPLAHMEIAVFDENGDPACPGEVGEVAVKSAAAIESYEGDDPKPAGSFRNGYFFTGDLGTKKSDGLLYLVGRKGLLINKAGYKINPREIEKLLEDHPLIEEAVVFGVPTSFGDEKIHALVVPRQGCSVEILIDHCRGKIADFKIPSMIEFTEALPRTPTGKLRRSLFTQDPSLGSIRSS